MNSRIKLDLPELGPGQYPTEKCPCCWAKRDESIGGKWWKYECGAAYAPLESGPVEGWCSTGKSEHICPNPLPSVILYAVLDSLSQKQLHSPINLLNQINRKWLVRHGIGAAAKALEDRERLICPQCEEDTYSPRVHDACYSCRNKPFWESEE